MINSSIQILMENADPEVVLERMADSAATVLHYACYHNDLIVTTHILNSHLKNISFTLLIF